MKRVYVCGSFSFADKIEQLETRLNEEGIPYISSKSVDARGITACLEKIDNSDAVYVVNPEGYVGRSVCLDIGYAYARNKPIFVMHSVDDPPLMKLVDGTLSFDELISFLRKDDEVSTQRE
jgi:hypothetical protein